MNSYADPEGSQRHTRLETCDSCLRLARGLTTHQGDRLCASCRSMFWTAEALFDGGVTDVDEIVTTMVYAAWKGRPQELVNDENLRRDFEREFPRKHKEFDLLEIVDGVPILRLKLMTVSVIRHDEAGIPERVQMSILSRFADPETVAERYQKALRDGGIPWDRSNMGTMEWAATNNRLTVSLAPPTYAADAIPRLKQTARELWPSFPPPELVREFYRALLGSADQRTFRGFAYYLGEHGRTLTHPRTRSKEAKTVIPACAAWLIGERREKVGERVMERRIRIAGVLNRHLLGPLEMRMLPEDAWESKDSIWRDAQALKDRLGRVSYFLQSRTGD